MEALENQIPNLKDQLQQVINRHFDQTWTLNNVTGQDIGEGIGFVCHVYRLTLMWQQEQDGKESVKQPKTIIAKFPLLTKKSGLMEELSAKMDRVDHEHNVEQGSEGDNFIIRLHNDECTFYTLFEGSKPPMLTATFYGLVNTSKPYNLLIMEDLSADACLEKSIADGMSRAQVYSVVDALVSLQAWCLTTTVDWTKKIPTRAEKFGQNVPIWKIFTEGLAAMRKMVPDQLSDAEFDTIELFFSSPNFMSWYMETAKLMPYVLVHGDLWTNNILFIRNNHGEAGSQVRALIDWQLCNIGCCMEDMAHFLSWVLPATQRRASEEELLYYYWKTFVKKVGERPGLTLENVHLQYNRCFRQNAYCFFCLIPMLLGTVVKSDVADGADRKKEIVTRALAACRDAMTRKC